MEPLLPPVDPVKRLPIVVLAVHSGCDCRCEMCDIWRRRDPTEVAVAEVERWCREWHALDVQQVVLTGGEPLLHSDLPSLLEMLAASGVGLTLLTSGLGLEEHAPSVARWCERVVVSLDGPPAVHDRIRGVKEAFARLEAGVNALRNSGSRVRITARCTVQRRNHNVLAATVGAARELRLDGISFLAVDTATDAFNRRDPRALRRVQRLALDPEHLPAVAAELERLAHDHIAGFVEESPAKLRRRLLDHFRARCGLGEYPPLECNAPWVSAFIEADMSVRPCFFHPSYGTLDAGATLADVVNSKSARAFRNQLDVASNPTCRTCVCHLALRRGEEL